MNRKGVIMLMFDLPMANKEQRRAYNKFRGTLIKNGYMQMQESLYVKLLKSTAYEKKKLQK